MSSLQSEQQCHLFPNYELTLCIACCPAEVTNGQLTSGLEKAEALGGLVGWGHFPECVKRIRANNGLKHRGMLLQIYCMSGRPTVSHKNRCSFKASPKNWFEPTGIIVILYKLGNERPGIMNGISRPDFGDVSELTQLENEH